MNATLINIVQAVQVQGNAYNALMDINYMVYSVYVLQLLIASHVLHKKFVLYAKQV